MQVVQIAAHSDLGEVTAAEVGNEARPEGGIAHESVIEAFRLGLRSVLSQGFSKV